MFYFLMSLLVLGIGFAAVVATGIALVVGYLLLLGLGIILGVVIGGLSTRGKN